MVNRFKSSAVKCILQGYPGNIGGIAFKWQRRWAVILSQLIFSGIIWKHLRVFLILFQKTEMLQNSFAFAKKKKCGCCCDPVLTCALSGILVDCLLIF